VTKAELLLCFDGDAGTDGVDAAVGCAVEAVRRVDFFGTGFFSSKESRPEELAVREGLLLFKSEERGMTTGESGSSLAQSSVRRLDSICGAL